MDDTASGMLSTLFVLVVACGLVVLLIKRPQPTRIVFARLVSLLMVALAALELYGSEYAINADSLVYRVSVLGTWALVVSAVMVMLRGGMNLFSSISLVTIVGVLFAHLSWQLLSLLGVLEVIPYVFFDANMFFKATTFASAGVLALVAGVLWALSAAPLGAPHSRNHRGDRVLFGLGIIVTCGGIALTAANILTVGIGAITSATYSDISVTSGLNGLFYEGKRLVVLGSIFALAGANLSVRRDQLMVVGLILTSLILSFLWGMRGFALSFMVACIYVYAIRARVPLVKVAVATVVMGAVIISTGYARNVPLAQRSLSDYVEPLMEDAQGALLKLFTMPGLQISPLVRAMIYYPDMEEFRYGADYYAAALEAAPFTVYVVPGLSQFEYSSEWLSTHTVDQSVYLSRYGVEKGVGSSILTEAYMNFGPAGLALIPFLVGVLMVWLDRQARATYQLATVAVIACLDQAIVWWIRNSISAIPRTILITLLLFVIYKMYMAKRDERAYAGSPHQVSPTHLPSMSLANDREN